MKSPVFHKIADLKKIKTFYKNLLFNKIIFYITKLLLDFMKGYSLTQQTYLTL